jgi:uncharacterized protein (TIGR02145 family)
MKKKLLLMMTCVPVLLFAEGNGVKVSNLAVSVGSPTTVTFNVSWNKTDMPLVWSDSVWVWVDYNNAGKMERLPVTGGTASAGTVIKVPNNDKGVRIAGNARSAGSFSATVNLLTALADVAGVCAYASNYPPVGEYISATEISFTGTPMYEIALAHLDGGSVTVKSGDMLLLPCDYTVASFTDATGAPGIKSCTVPGSTVTFTAFNPCLDAFVGAVWHLIDERESNNVQTYKVRKMPDGHIWMVQDMKFGDKCNKKTFNGSTKNQTGNVTSLTDKDYYGDCTAATTTATPPNRGYLYDWAAAINKSGAFYGSSAKVGCSGISSGTVSPNPSSCQGICPVGWHVPTGNTDGEQAGLLTASGYTVNWSSTFWASNTIFEGTSYHWFASSTVYSTTIYISSTFYGNNAMYTVCNGTDYSGSCDNWTIFKHNASALRCLMNY